MSGTALQISESLRQASEKLAMVIGSNPLEPVFKKAEVVIAVREWLGHPEVMGKVRQLQNTPSGFQTDEKAGYDDKTLAVCVTDALCAGFQLVGNEFNIIGGRMMGVLNGYNRLVDAYEDEKKKLVFKEVVEGNITVNGNMVKVPMTVKYKLLDKASQVTAEHTFTRDIQLVKRYDKEGPDAWIGKATRRILKKLLVNLSGNDFGDDLGDEGNAGSGTAPAAGGMPPVGKTELKKEVPPKATDAEFSEVVGGDKKGPDWTPAPEEPKSGKKGGKPPEPPRADDTF